MIEDNCTAFAGFERIANGSKVQVAKMVKELMLEKSDLSPVLIFSDNNSDLIEIDFRGSVEDVARRIETPARNQARAADETESARGRGRPKLGVVAREVTLLPRHWDWLNAQAGGASVALRKLVEAARRADDGQTDSLRLAQESTYRFMSHLAGNLPGFEEASRALFAGNREQFGECIAGWPKDVVKHLHKISATAFSHA